MDYDVWLKYQNTMPVKTMVFDMRWNSYVSLVPCDIAGLVIVKIDSYGYLVLNQVIARKDFPLLFEPAHRYFEGARPISVFIEPGTVYAPYIPILTKK